jgi:hypothetical protein
MTEFKSATEELVSSRAQVEERKFWRTPRVILAQVEKSGGGLNYNTDVDYEQTS